MTTVSAEGSGFDIMTMSEPYLVCILGIDVVLNSLNAGLGKIRWGNLHEVGDLCLEIASDDD